MKRVFYNIFSFFKRSSVQKEILGVLGVLVLIGLYSALPQPKVLQADEVENRKVAYNAPFTIRFSQPVHFSSVEKAFSIKPRLSGEFNWADRRTLEFVPDDFLRVGDEYTVKLAGSAKGLSLKRVNKEASIEFVVAGPPMVSYIDPTLPEIETEETEVDEEKAPEEPKLIVGESQRFTIMFDRPMNVEEIDLEQDVLEVEPALQGDFKWIGQRVIEFTPAVLPMGTAYKATVKSGLPALDGGETEEDTVFEFETPAPKVTFFAPEQEASYVQTETPLVLEFNQEMALDYIEPGRNALLFPSNDVDADITEKNDGFFNTEVTYGKNAEGKVDKRIIEFKPTFPFQHDTEYRFVLASGLEGGAKRLNENEEGYGNIALSEDFELKFTIAAKPEVLSISAPDENNVIEMQFASPMLPEVIQEAAVFDPELPSAVSVQMEEEGLKALVSASLLPSESYTVKIPEGTKDANGNRFETAFEAAFETKAIASSMELVAPHPRRAFKLNEEPVFEIETINVAELELDVCAVSQTNFISTTSRFAWDRYNCFSSTKVKESLLEKANKRQVTSLNLAELFGRDFEEGLYFLSVQGSELIENEDGQASLAIPFIVSGTGLMTKKSTDDLMVYAFDLSTGSPVSRMDITIYSREGEELLRGVTDGIGTYTVSKPLPSEIVITGRKKIEGESRYSLTMDRWSTGITQPGQTGQWIKLNEPRLMVFSPKQAYASGETIYYKGYYRIDLQGLLGIPEDRSIDVSLENELGESIQKKRVPLQADGSFHGSFVMPAGQSNYELVAKARRSFPYEDRFAISAAKSNAAVKGELEIRIANADVVSGDELRFDIFPRFEIEDNKVYYKLYKQQKDFNRFEGGHFFVFNRLDSCDTCEKVLVEQGELSLNRELMARLEHETEETEFGYVYTLETMARAENGEAFASSEIAVHPAAYYVGVGMKKKFISEEDSFQADFVTVSHQGDILEEKPVEIVWYKIDGEDLEEVGESAFFTDNAPLSVALDQRKGFEPGHYLLQAKTSDETGREVMAETDFYVTGPGNDFAELKVIPDQSEYLPGGKARLLIQGLENAEEALLTVEREGIIDYDLIEYDEKDPVIELPITEDMLPNVEVAIAAYNKNTGRLEMDRAPLFVSHFEKEVLIETELSPLLDGSTLLKLNAMDYQRRPLEAIFTVSVLQDQVNEADPIEHFYTQRAVQLMTASNLNMPGKIAGDQPVFDNKDLEASTASAPVLAFKPMLPSDNAGYAELALNLPKKGTGTILITASSGKDLFGSKNTTFTQVEDALALKATSLDHIVAGDEFSTFIHLNNQTEEPIETAVELSSAALIAADGNKQNAFIPARDMITLKYDIASNPMASYGQVTYEVAAGNQPLVETVKIEPLPKRYFRLFQGEFKEKFTKNISIEHENKGQLVLTMSTHPAAKIIPFIRHESTVSSKHLAIQLMPLLHLEGLDEAALGRFISKAALQAKLDLLASYQKTDGGYGLLRNSASSDPISSALSVHVMALADDLGFNTPVRRNTGYLYGVTQEDVSAQEKLFALWGLGAAGEFDTRQSLAIYENRAELSIFERAVLLQNLTALHDAGQRSVFPFIQRLQSELITDLDQNEEDIDDKTLAAIYLALVSLDENNVVAERIAPHLSRALDRAEGLADIDYAWALTALIKRENAPVELEEDVSVKVNLGEVTLEETFASTEPFKVVQQRIEVTDALESLPLKFETRSEVPIHYDITFETIDTAKFEPSNNELVLSREYRDNEGQLREANFKEGESYIGTLTVAVSEDAENVVIKEPLPAGFKLLEVEFADPVFAAFKSAALAERFGYNFLSDPIWHFEAVDTSDDYVIWHAEKLPAGVYHLRFAVSAKTPGQFRHMPAFAGEVHTESQVVEVK